MTTYDLHKKFTPEEMDSLYQQVISLLTSHKKYKDPKFDSTRLAEVLHLNEHELTFLLKTRFHCNFSRLLNRYRLEEMCYMLKHPQWADQSILEIAYAVGFYNRQTYRTIFRKATGLSPREYRKMYQMDWKGQAPAKKQRPMTERKLHTAHPAESFEYAQERFADIQMLRYQVPGFAQLSLRQKLLVYHLSEAALWGRDIFWDQNGAYGLRIRQTLEAIYTHYEGNREEADFKAFEVYLKRVWFSSGIHHHYGCHKLEAGFSQEFLTRQIESLPAEALPFVEEKGKTAWAAHCAKLLFDPQLMPLRVNQAEGEDLLLTSSCNYYAEGITQAEAEGFYRKQKEAGDKARPVMTGMNSRLERSADGTLWENVYRRDGLYGPAIEKICRHLEQAIPYSENEQQKEVIRKLIEFYESGDLKTFDQYTILWVAQTQGDIDFINGFTEVYGDPLGLKASWEGYVNVNDREASRRASTLSDNAQWFEDHSPVDARFKKKECRGVSARVVNAIMLGGDLYPSSAIGINLPNNDWVRAHYGSKSVTIGNLTHAYNMAARGNGFKEEFVIDRETLDMIYQWGDPCDDLHTDLHECLGHGSGQLLPGVDPDALKAYGSTIEEARADLFGLYYMASPKLLELGLTPHPEAYKSHYYTYLMNGLMTQLVRIEPGHDIQEAHMRNRALIAHWVLENRPEAVAMVLREGRTFVEVKDYQKLQEAFGSLLAEIQRIKSEGDYQAAKELVEKYGVKVDAPLHEEILNRYKKLDLAPYKGFINPRMKLEKDKEGAVVDVSLDYTESYTAQMLRYSQDYHTLI